MKYVFSLLYDHTNPEPTTVNRNLNLTSRYTGWASANKSCQIGNYTLFIQVRTKTVGWVWQYSLRRYTEELSPAGDMRMSKEYLLILAAAFFGTMLLPFRKLPQISPSPSFMLTTHLKMVENQLYQEMEFTLFQSVTWSFFLSWAKIENNC